jgi:hypothetical protein
MRSRAVGCGVLVVALVLGGMSAATGQTKGAPNVSITIVPPWDPGGPDRLARIGGVVSGVACDCKIVVFARGDVWYVQPWVAAPDTTIGRDGKWENDTHLGTEYAALLVRSRYKAPSTTGILPAVSGDIVAITRVPGKR